MSPRVLAPFATGPGWLTDPPWHRVPGEPGAVAFIAPLVWVTDAGELVTVPAHYPIDGASIPRALWSFGHPLEPWVLRAAGVHDWLCDHRDARGSAWVHRQFGLGLRADARTRWERVRAWSYPAAVHAFGPRWAAAGTP